MQRRQTLLALLLAAASLVRAWALPSFEPFADASASGGTAYPNGATLYHQTNALGEGWARWNGGASGFAVACTNTGLSYGQFPSGCPTPSPTHAVYLPGQADKAGGAAGSSAALTFSHAVKADPNSNTIQSVYASFLLKVPNLGNLNSGSPIYFAGFATNTGDQSLSLPASALKLYLMGNAPTAGQSATYSIGIANNSGSTSAAWDGGGHTSNDVLFVVLDYEFGIAGAPDAARLWVNPYPWDFSLPVVPPPTATLLITGSTTALAQATDFFLLARSGTTLWGSLLVSMLRVGTTWSYVTCGPDTVLPALSLAAANGKAMVSGVNGVPGATNYLVSSTNISSPLTNWTRMATNRFDSAGHCTLTNSLKPSEPRRFYALQEGPVPSSNDALWIPACGSWLGAVVTNGSTSAFSDHEAHIGRQLDILRFYHSVGSWTQLTTPESNYINAGRKVFVSFKPSSQWSNAVGVASGGSATVDAQLATLAKSVAGIKPSKMMICVWHEPQNDVGSTGTTNQYVAMWQNVRTIFDANGATNVIWCLVVQGYGTWLASIPSLWPGNRYVDWVAWDAYQNSSGEDFVSTQTGVYNWMTTNSTPQNNYLSKPWAWAEWGVGVNTYVPTLADQTNTISAINAALQARRFPRIRYLAYFDTDAAPNATSAILPGAWGTYSNLANSPYLTQQCH